MQRIYALVSKTDSDQTFFHMKIGSFEVVPSFHYAPATKKQRNNRETKEQQQKNKQRTNKQTKN